MSKKITIKRKVLVLGTFAVGKTSLVNRFVINKFSDIYIPTIGVSIKKKTIELDDVNVDMVIWDIADVATFDVIPEHYLSGAHGVLIVFDLTRPETLKKSLEGVQNFKDSLPQSALYIVGNKKDILEHKVDGPMNELGITEVHTSAKSGENVEELFAEMAQKIIS